ncbi:MAG TPA: phytanoyl-CoA dioxygenase family protein [Capsulimonadaceae bacterium]|jgi:hypothetical protein
MDSLEQYEFDRTGYLVLPGMLTASEVADLRVAVDRLEEHALRHVDAAPRKVSPWGAEYHRDADLGYHAQGSSADGKTLIIEDFFNADRAFDFLVDHPRTMAYINGIVQGRVRINNSEIRLRYHGNATGSHMGGPIAHKYRYAFNSNGPDCMMVRMIYFLHDVSKDDGAFCVVPGTHKTNLPPPYGSDPDTEPGMIPLEVKAGDAVLFTEHLRHGGYVNRSRATRKTLHIGYGPSWMMSQNIATMDEPQYFLPETLERYTEAQRKLVVL